MKNWVKLACVAVVLLTTGAFLTSLPQNSESHFVRLPEPLTPVSRVTILFGGDMLFDRTIRTAMENKGNDYIFSCIDDVLQAVDLVVANLEGPITSNPSKSVGTKPGGAGNYTFTFPTSTATLLARHNIGIVNIGNNHILNFGYEGLEETKTWLERAHVGWFGDADLPEEGRVERVSVRGVPFSFVNWSEWTSINPESTIEQIQKEARNRREVIVYAHWGEEYEPATERVKSLAHSFVDAGADIVIGSHPHVVQERELYRGAYIYYSLGNFIFDQYWSDTVQKGLLVRVSFSPTGIVGVEEVPIRIQTDRRVCLE